MPTDKSFAPSFALKVLLPSIVAVGSIAALLLYIVNGIFEETNRLDQAHSERLATSAVDVLRDNLETVLLDNAVWDEAAEHVGTNIDLHWSDQTWGLATGLGVYDTVFVIDAAGATHYAAQHGKRQELDALDYLGTDLNVLLARVNDSKARSSTSSGIVATGDTLSTFGVARIVRTAKEPAPDQEAHFLILARTIDKSLLATVARRFAMEELKIAEGGKRPAGDSIAIFSPSGRIIGTLTWQSRSPGDVVREKFGPVVSVVLAMFLFVIVILLYMSWKGFKDANDSQEAAVSASLRDDLTGLANRREMLAVLADCVEKARSNGGQLSVIYADLDGFKEVNDSYGHEIGDKLLKAVAAGFAFIGKGADVIARLGGDEFALIFTGANGGEKARTVAHGMIAFLQEPMIFDGRIASVSVSAGIVDLEDDDATVEEIIRRADVAMYKAKADGRSRAFVYQRTLDFKRDENRSIAHMLREHIDQGRLTVVYQPIVDARTRRIKGVEALVRWPKDAPIRFTPDVFIPVAEEFGLIEDLGYFVLVEACRQAAQWEDIFVAVNVSPLQFMNPSFGDIVETTLARTGLDAKRLEIEVTEGFVIDNAARANAIIGRLHDMRVRVALDDFGTGFSSIGHLRRFKFDKLKLDRSMVSDIMRQPSALRLVQGTIAMADALGLTVLAEGIEDESQVSVLRLAGCSQFQGFLFSKPVEAVEITAVLQNLQRDTRSAIAI